ncbi:anti-sigma factor [Leucobacter chromiireducens]|uniref:anti-sigma factor n=1 Tax=Leucobacter chromiireducens TaxID=283877 RepID=UPI000F63AD1E|nr:anti-sigma factor [Leucobacter chromiireducens]
MNEQEFRELSAARALHALSPEEEQRFSHALSTHPAWRTIVDEDRETAAAIGAAAPEVAPPAAARASILELIARSPQFVASEADDPEAGSPPLAEPAQELDPEPASESDPEPRRTWRSAKWFALAASIAVLLTVSLAMPWTTILAPQDPVALALQRIEQAADADTATAPLPGGGEGTLHWSDAEAEAVLVTDGLASAPEGRDYELWIVRGDAPTSLGVVRAGTGGASMTIATGFEPGDALAVTVEAEGGSPSGAPTTDPILVLATT